MKGEYFRRRDLLFRLPLTAQQKLVLGRLHDYAGNGNNAHPSQARLADDLSLSDRQVRTYLRDLETAGFVTTKRRRQAVAIHSLNWSAIESGIQDRKRASSLKSRKTGSPLPVSSDSRPEVQRRKTGSTASSRPEAHFRPNAQERSITNTPAAPSDGFSRNKIDPGEFKSLDRGLCRFMEYVSAGKVRDADRLRFLVLWLWCGRNRDRNPVGAFVNCIKDREWNGGDGIEDEVRVYLAGKKPKTNGTHPALAKAMQANEVDDLREFDE